jgi:hypothetical protein
MAQIILDSANNLIQGDFDTATLSLRTRMQTSTTNATTGVYVVPNGSATSASVQVSNAADPTNASKVVVATNASTDTQIVSGANGSGSYLPLSFYTNNDIRFQMGNAGELNVRTAPGTVSSGTSGQFLTSGGPGAGVSWTTAAAGGFSNMQVFASPGTFTTPATTTKIKVTVVGGGGGGGKAQPSGRTGSGGGGGGAAIYVGSVSASTPYAVTVGAAGAASTPGPGTGGTGGTSSFTTLASATGGTGGSSGAGGSGVGGAGSAGTLQFAGSSGAGGAGNGPTGGAAGSGGSSFLGGGGTGGVDGPAGGVGRSYGGGGGGGSINTPSTFSDGGAGAGGVVVVEY